MGGDSELELLKEWRKGSREAGGRLVTVYYPRLRRFFTGSVGEDDAEDLTNDTLGRAMTTTVEVNDATDVRIFLFCLARRVLYDHLRKSYRRDARGFDPLTHSVEDVDGVTPSQAVAELEQHHRILECMRTLPVETKLLLELHYWQGLKPNELAPIFEVKPTTIRTRLHGARKLLRELLIESDESFRVQHTTNEIADEEREPEDDELTHELRSVGEILSSGPSTR